MARSRSTPLLALLLALALSSPRPGYAGLVPGSDEPAGQIQHADWFVRVEPGVETLVERLELSPGNGPVAFFRAFPVVPSEVRAVEFDFFDRLKASTRIEKPHREEVGERIFGPSLLTVAQRIYERASGASAINNAPPPLQENLRTLSFQSQEIRYFSGATHSSTITRRRYLPDSLEAWIAENRLQVNERDRLRLSYFCDQGWSIAAVLLPRRGTREVIGPVLYRFATDKPFAPALLSFVETQSAQTHALYVEAERPMTIAGYATLFNPSPWSTRDKPQDTLEVLYNRAPEPVFALDLERMLGAPFKGSSRIMQGNLHTSGPPPRDLTLVAAPSSVDLPSRSKRGSWIDIVLCVILGMAPLLYTPESWFAFALGTQARERVRRRLSKSLGLGHFLWPLFALGVAAYWAVTLEGAGRVAALVPLFLGILQLASPPPDRERGPVRIDFERRKAPKPQSGKSAATKPAPSKSDQKISLPPKGASLPPKTK